MPTTATESTNPSDYKWSLIKGEQGNQGVPGEDGADGTTYYTWIKYSDVANPTSSSQIYDDPKSTTEYIGIAVNQTSQTESTDQENTSGASSKEIKVYQVNRVFLALLYTHGLNMPMMRKVMV